MSNSMEPLEIASKDVEKITEEFEAHEEKIFSKPNVVGVGVGTKVTGGKDTKKPCVKVLVAQKLRLEDAEGLITQSDFVDPKVGTTETDVEEVGELVIQCDDKPAAFGSDIQTFTDEEATIQLLRQRLRPAEGGYSVGHYKITAGTIATAVYDRSPYPGIPRKYYILSNNHVLANSNVARVGDPILQPGPYDGGQYPQDQIARLSRWVPIRFGGQNNLVDAAIAEGPFHWLDREIYWIGYVKGTKPGWPKIGETLQKTGRTTNYTTGSVTAINATVNVGGYHGGTARFVKQIVTTAMSAGGDSGSLVLDMEENAVGLLFAGSSQVTIMNHIAYVQGLLGIRIV